MGVHDPSLKVPPVGGIARLYPLFGCPVGMKHDDPQVINLDRIAETAIVCNVVTKPPLPPLLVEAKNRGRKIQNGLQMADALLLHQMTHLGLRSW